jgi:hypothetical protein
MKHWIVLFSKQQFRKTSPFESHLRSNGCVKSNMSFCPIIFHRLRLDQCHHINDQDELQKIDLKNKN